MAQGPKQNVGTDSISARDVCSGVSFFERSASGAVHHIYYFLFILYYLKKQVLT